MGKAEISEWMAGLARRKAKKMTKAQRKAHAVMMNRARWAKREAEVINPALARRAKP